jgi:hypothetical protein
MRVSVSWPKDVFHCFTAGCTFAGNAVTLARSMGLVVDSAEYRQRAAALACRLEWERRAHELRVKEWRRVTERIRTKRREYDDVRAVILAGGDVTTDVIGKGLLLYNDLRRLDAELLLVEVLPDWFMCCFVLFGAKYREREIAEVLKRGGVLVRGVFHDLPPFGPWLEVSDEAGPEMPDESWTPRIQPGPTSEPLSLEEIDAQAKAFRTAAEKAGSRQRTRQPWTAGG